LAAVPSIGRASFVEAPRVAPQAAATQGLYERHAAKIQSYCQHQLGSREEAEDAVQTTFMNAFRALGRGVVPEAESAWLFKIAENVCLSRRRSSWRRGRIESPSDFAVIEEIVPGPSRQRDELIGIEDALASMPEQQRRAILLREWQGLSYREIAAELEVSQSAVETLIFRARRSLAQGLEQPDAIKPAKRKSFRRALHMIDFGTIAAAAKTLLAGSAAVKATAAAVAVTAAAGTAASVAPKLETKAPLKAPVTALVAPAPAAFSTSSTATTVAHPFASSAAGTADSAPKPLARVAPLPAEQKPARAALSRSARTKPAAAAPDPTAPIAVEPVPPAVEPAQPVQAEPVEQAAPAPTPAAEQPKHEERRLESAPSASEPAKRKDEGKENEGRKDEGKRDEGRKDEGKHKGRGAESPPTPAVADPAAAPTAADPVAVALVASTPRERPVGNSKRNDEQGKHASVTEAPTPASVTAVVPAPVDGAKEQDSKKDRQRRTDGRGFPAGSTASPVPAPAVPSTEPVPAPASAPAAEATPAPAPVADSSDKGSSDKGSGGRSGRRKGK